MSIESKVVEKKEAKAKDSGYPVLKISQHNKLIVLFTAKKDGVVVGNPTDDGPIGHNSGCWLEEVFDTFNGKVTLKNNP